MIRKIKITRLSGFVFSLLAMIFMMSCNEKDKNETIPDLGYSYFPVNVGRWSLYEADSVYHSLDVNNKPVSDTIRFQLKRVFESEMYDNSNRLTQIIRVYTRSSDTSAWKQIKTCTSTLTRDAAEWKEDNNTYLKLAFPVALSRTWNGNNYNTQPEREYKYTAVNEPEAIGALSFDSTVTVTQIDEENLIEKKYAVEKYAKHAGLIFTEVKSLEKIIDNANTIKEGYEFRMKIKAFQQ